MCCASFCFMYLSLHPIYNIPSVNNFQFLRDRYHAIIRYFHVRVAYFSHYWILDNYSFSSYRHFLFN